MQTQTIIFPAQIVRGPGVIHQLGDICARWGKRGMLIGGHTALEVAASQVRAQLDGAGVALAATEWFGGECSQNNIERLAALARDNKVDVIIGTGGGKSLDTSKAVGVAVGLPVITLPTTAATCAAVTPLTVRYHDNGHFHDLYPLPQAPVRVLIDSNIMAQAPLRWLAAGLGDTLAKWYEFRAISGAAPVSGVARSSSANSRICYDLIDVFGPQACQGVREGRATPALDQVLDAIFMFAGLTSLMSNGAHAAAAHAIYEGFTECDKTREFGHGLLVGFGNLCLLALENRPDAELFEALKLAYDCGIPLRLSDIAALDADELQRIVQASVRAPDMLSMPGPVTEHALYQAIARVETLAKQAGL